MVPSSPMTVTSLSTASEIPALTAGTTAQSSPSPLSRSPSLTPPPPAFTEEPPLKAKPAAKRKSAASTAANGTPKAKKSKTSAAAPAAAAEEDKPERGTYCHQCRTKCEPEGVLRCTRLRKYTKATPARACNLAWCERDLEKRYEVDPTAIRTRGQNVSADELAQHDTEKGYVFACPCCLDECQNSTCRKKKGLEPLGDVVKLATESGLTPLEFIKDFDAGGSGAAVKATGNGAVDEGEESELTDPDAPVVVKKTAPKKKTKKAADPAADSKEKGKKAAAPLTSKTAATKTKKDTKPKATMAKDKDAKTKGKAAAATTSKAAKGKAAAAKDKKDKGTGKDVKPKAPPKPKVVVAPDVPAPVFNPVDTRMGFDEVEQRLYVREFINRFRQLLSIPDRALAPLDDFDHALSDASVRTLAGALLDLIVADNGVSYGSGPVTVSFIEEKRDELRSAYADLGRFAQIYREIADELGLVLPPAVDTTRDRNTRAMRALLELGVDEPTPSWAVDSSGPSRRGASRIPQAREVIRMLIALIDYVSNLEAVKWHMDPATLNSANDELRKSNHVNKEENARWDAEKKSIMVARVKCKTAEATKANKAQYDAAEHEHNMRVRAANFRVYAVQQRKLMRFSSLGTDLDGRVYFALTPRLLDDERYNPTGWTRGVMVWGPGIDGQNADARPWQVERWSHFSTAKDVGDLARWVRDRFLKEIRRLEEVQAAKPPSKKALANGTSANGTRPPLSNRRSTFEGVRASKLEDELDNSDAESELSAAPSTRDDLLALLDPEGYEPSVEAVGERMAQLFYELKQVDYMLEVLEWRAAK